MFKITTEYSMANSNFFCNGCGKMKVHMDYFDINIGGNSGCHTTSLCAECADELLEKLSAATQAAKLRHEMHDAFGVIDMVRLDELELKIKALADSHSDIECVRTLSEEFEDEKTQTLGFLDDVIREQVDEVIKELIGEMIDENDHSVYFSVDTSSLNPVASEIRKLFKIRDKYCEHLKCDTVSNIGLLNQIIDDGVKGFEMESSWSGYFLIPGSHKDEQVWDKYYGHVA